MSAPVRGATAPVAGRYRGRVESAADPPGREVWAWTPDGAPLGGSTVVEHLLLGAVEFAKDRRVARDEFDVGGHHVVVSTVFLVTGLRRDAAGRPLIYETMVFVDGATTDAVQAATRAGALEEHAAAVARARGAAQVP